MPFKDREKLRAYQREWDRRRNYKEKYGITVEEYEQMYADQQGRCTICEAHFPTLVVDHDHETGLIRGLLCNNCNVGLGMFSDDTVRLSKAIEYLSGLC